MKKCSKCRKEKELSEFNKRGNGIQAACRECNSNYLKEHYKNNKQYYIDKARVDRDNVRQGIYDWLATKSCVDCGNSDTRVLEFDHLYDKEFTISTKVGVYGPERLVEEIMKCDIICANCHRIRTYSRGNFLKSTYLPIEL